MNKIDKNNIADILPLSPTQEGMLFYYRLQKDSNLYFEQHRLTLRGKFQLELFTQAVSMAFEANEMLRTVFRWEGLQAPVQLILKQKTLEIPYFDWSELPSGARERKLSALLSQDKQTPFTLELGNTIRIQVVRMELYRYEVIWSFHHILMDGWSSGILLREIFTAYGQLCSGLSPAIKQKAKYKEYLRFLKEASKEHSLSYWKDSLQGISSPTPLPYMRDRNEERKYSSYHLRLSRTLTETLEETSKRYRVTISTLLQAAWGILLQKYSDTRDALFEVAYAGRPAHLTGVEEIVGLFIKTYPLRVKRTETTTVKDLLGVMMEEQHQMAPHLYVPAVELKNCSEMDVQTPLAHSLFVFQNYPIDKTLAGLELDFELENITSHETTDYPLVLEVTPGDEWTVHVNYQAWKFQAKEIERLALHYQSLLEQIAADPDQEIRDLTLLSDHERHEMIEEQMKVVPVPSNYCVHELIDQAAEKTPDAVALVQGERTVTYKELQEQANRLSCALQKEVTDAGRPIVIMCDRSPEMITALLAILKAGCYYVPLDPDLPKARMEQIVSQIQPSLIVTEGSYLELVADLQTRVFRLDEPACWAQELTQIPQRKATPSSTAYAIFTSGSTGTPKGVRVKHDQLINALWWHIEFVGFGEQTRTLQIATLTFDASVVEIFCTLISGGTLCLLQRHENKSPQKLAAAIESQQANAILVVPTMYHALLDHAADGSLDSIQKVLCTGEMLSSSLVERHTALLPQARMYNLYGPTENSISASGYCVPRQGPFENPLPIGHPSYNVRVFLLDQDFHLLPKGVIGEMYVGGMGVTEGYIADEEKTRASYILTPYGRLYRTGDLACWTDEGHLQYFGRKDFQIKIRGNRVELEEIEAVLRRQPGVREAAVVAIQESKRDPYLVACLAAMHPIGEHVLRDAVLTYLPDYMLPAFFVHLDALPRTQSGKVDKTALQRLDYTQYRSGKEEAPADELEQQLAQIWRELLTVEKISVHDHFFSLGGHSLKAAQLVTRLQKERKTDITIKDVFQNPTIRQLADRIRGRQEISYTPIDRVSQAERYRASSSQKRIFVMHGIEGESTSYNMSGVIAVNGHLDVSRVNRVLKEIIQRHEAFRTSFAVQDGEVYQYISDHVPFEIQTVHSDGRTLDEVMEDFRQSFDLTKAPLLQVCLVEVTATQHYLLFNSHHIILDGISLNVLMEDFSRLYVGEELPALPIQYKDYADWQWQKRGSEQWNQQEKYWVDTFSDRVPLMAFPLDYPRPTVKTFQGDHHTFFITDSTYSDLHAFAKQNEVTVHAVLMSAYYVLLMKYTSQEDFVVGSLVAGRNHPDLERIVGVFINFLPIRNRPRAELVYTDFVQEVQRSLFLAYEHQEYPFEEIVARSAAGIQQTQNPLFDTMLIFHNQREQEVRFTLGDVQFEEVPHESKTSKLDFKLDITPLADQFRCVLEYDTQLFKAEAMEGFADNYLRVLAALLKHPKQQLDDVDIVHYQTEKEGVMNRLHHVGVAVPELGPAQIMYGTLGFDASDSLQDPEQNVYLSMCMKPGSVPIELIAPVDETSPCVRLLEEKGTGPYHLCYSISNINHFLKRLVDSGFKYDLVSAPKPAVLFNHRLVAFLFLESVGLIELVESEDTKHDEWHSNDQRSAVRLLTPDADQALSFFTFLGYRVHEKYLDRQSQASIITLGKASESSIQLVEPLMEHSQEQRALMKNGCGVYQIEDRVANLTERIDTLIACGIPVSFADRAGRNLLLTDAPYLLLTDGKSAAERPKPILGEFHSEATPIYSFVQERLLKQEQEEGILAVRCFDIEVRSRIEPSYMQQAWQALTRRFPQLLTQGLSEPIPLAFWDLQEKSEAEATVWLRDRLIAEQKRPFEHHAGSLARFELVKLAADHYRLIGSLHSSISDWRGIGLLLEEWEALYQTIEEGHEPSTEEQPHYEEAFAVWQKKMLYYGHLEAERYEWLTAANLHSAQPFGTGGVAKRQVEQYIDPTSHADLLHVAAQSNQELGDILLASYLLLLRQVTQLSSLTLGVVTTNRTQDVLELTLGNFDNIVPLTIDMQAISSFSQLLDQTKQVHARMQALALYPSEHWQATTNMEWPTLFVNQTIPFKAQSTVWKREVKRSVEPEMAGSPLVLQVAETSEGIHVVFTFDPAMLQTAYVESLSDRYVKILKMLAEKSKIK
ncbi:edeine non-ribosomal peptide synthetase EdeN [Brevibacillus brevis]|uniref:edeine non-ribosomal peptide synthetase EdeN n=1 Tax=Brevibacillus brevis TaxID=1393 RepID=UPI0025A62D15|nr:edeine non-ribosomal peptide synthetase EdeN [Brevibacillus brevis]WJQ84571.1 edeine non-ribosomal peptide synthetase EdeN [Brevibacillus brevis]